MLKQNASGNPLFIVLISVHGLIRGDRLELGRDADTGGQTKYVVELARALGERSDVGRVMLLTRRIVDPLVSADYAEPVEHLSDKVCICRVECGEQKYLRKELLWDALENFSDNALQLLKQQARLPDILHSHYADAGYVGSRLAHQLGIPLVHTGHSLGHGKRKRLLASGVERSELESVYRISKRISAEEDTLAVAERVIASTQQEVEQQYSLYDFYNPERMRVIPPGIDTRCFYPPRGDERKSLIAAQLKRFLRHPGKPVILAISRADPKKNIVTLVEAYGQSALLQETANLVIVAGNRDDIQEMECGARTVLGDVLLAIDRYDLYGKVAFPKHHAPEDVGILFRLAAMSRGVFVNPALTEPFGLTLIEAAASGLPIVATEDGGPIDIVRNCQNGYLVDPLDKGSIADTLMRALSDRQAWRRFARNGIHGVRQHYSWSAHVEKYLHEIRPLAEDSAPVVHAGLARRSELFGKKAVFTSLDLNLIGDRASLAEFNREMQKYRKQVVFGVATGRKLDDALTTLRHYGIPRPDVLISGQGTAIHYAPDLAEDMTWSLHIDHLWSPTEVRNILKKLPGLELQPKPNQSYFKISYFIDPSAIDVQEVRHLLLRNEQTVNVVFSFGQFLDVLPVRASKGLALRWCCERLGIPLENTLVAGVTGADADMLRGNTMGVVLDNRHLEELSELGGSERVYFAQKSCASGILEAMEHYHFLTDCCV